MVDYRTDERRTLGRNQAMVRNRVGKQKSQFRGKVNGVESPFPSDSMQTPRVCSSQIHKHHLSIDKVGSLVQTPPISI